MKKNGLIICLIVLIAVAAIVFAVIGFKKGDGKKDDTKNNTSNSVSSNTSSNVTNSTVSNTNNTTNTTEESDSLKVGKYTLEYGKYSGKVHLNGTDQEPVEASYTINSDGTFKYATEGESASGTYKVIDFSEYGMEDTYGIEFSNDVKLSVQENNSLRFIAGAEDEFKLVK